jgi:plasmid stabilization system protein ParE
MAKVIWSPSSLDDIDSIAEYISKDSVYHASLFID